MADSAPGSFSPTRPGQQVLTPLEVVEAFLVLHQTCTNHQQLLYCLDGRGMLAPGAGEEIYLDDDKHFKVDGSIPVGAQQLRFILNSTTCLPYRLELVNAAGWRVRAFQWQCTGCFGEDAGCGVCGGSGWGVL